MPLVRLGQYLAPSKKTAFEFVLGGYQRAKSRCTQSHLGGTPYMEKPDKWPRCDHCKKESGFIGQFNMSETLIDRNETSDRGIYSLFFCWSCYKDGADSPSWVVRIYVNPKPSLRVVVEPDSPVVEITPCRITYKKVLMLPTWENIDQLDDKEALIALLNDVDGTNLRYNYKHVYSLLGCTESVVSSIGGYPQNKNDLLEEDCSQCGKSLGILVQIVSNNHSSIKWKKGTIGYILQCPDHREVIHFKLVCEE